MSIFYIVERACVLRDSVQLPPKRTERPAVDAVAMGCAQDVWPSLMYCTVDHKGSSIQEPYLSTVDNLPFVVHLNKIALLYEGKGNAEGVDPERGRVDGVA